MVPCCLRLTKSSDYVQWTDKISDQYDTIRTESKAILHVLRLFQDNPQAMSISAVLSTLELLFFNNSIVKQYMELYYKQPIDAEHATPVYETEFRTHFIIGPGGLTVIMDVIREIAPFVDQLPARIHLGSSSGHPECLPTGMHPRSRLSSLCNALYSLL